MRNIIDKVKIRQPFGRRLFSLKFTDKNDLTRKSILDVGCGFGGFTAIVLKYQPKEIIGLDIDPEVIEYCQKKIKSKKVKWLGGDVTRLPFKDLYFDTIFAWDVLEHLHSGNERKFFQESSRVLKKGGILYLSTPNNNIFSKLLDPAFFLKRHRHYQQENLLKLAKENNLSKEKLAVKGRWYSLLGGINLLISSWLFNRDMFFKNFFIKKENEEYTRPGFTGIYLKLKKYT